MSNDIKQHTSWLRMISACTAEEKMRNLEAADLMERLEAQNAELLEKVEQLKAERDAVVAALRLQGCDSCLYCDRESWEEPCLFCSADANNNEYDRWQWRGVQKEED